jgi:alanyl-tRNA synthetase
MGTQSRAPVEPDVRQFDATVERVDGAEVVLEETYFYPAGGGQPADRGVLAGERVDGVEAVDGDVVHYLVDPPAVSAGETVHGRIDDDFRTYCMRAHTASHLLYGAGRRLLDDLGYGGFDISERRVRVDFATTTDVDDETLVELERLVNRTVWEGREVTWERLPRDDALGREDVAFNTATEEGIEGETVRIIEVEGWDVAACGGTHVSRTDEIGPVAVFERSNPGEGLTRVEFAVGPTAIDRRAEDHRAARAAAAALDTRIENLPDAVGRLQDDREALTEQVRDLREQVVEARLADLADETITRDGVEWLVGSVPSDDANALAEFAQRLADDSAGVAALVGSEGSTLAVATDGTVDATDVVDGVTDAFGGGGGGSQTLAQAGGLSAEPGAVVAHLRE